MKTVLLTIIVALVVSLGVYAFTQKTDTPDGPEQDKVFNRILASKTIRCGYITWAPAFIKDSNTGRLSGINYDFMEEIGREMGWKIEWVGEVGVGEAVQALEHGKFDMMCASLWPDPNRIIYSDFTIATYYSAAYAYVRADDARFDGDLDKVNVPAVKVGGIDGDISADVARKVAPAATMVSLPQMADGSQLVLSLVTQKADVIFIDEPLAVNFAAANPGQIRKIAGVDAVRVFGEHLAVPNHEPKLLNTLNNVIGTLINGGVMDRILKRYDGVFIPPARTYGATPIEGKSSQ